MTTVGVLDSYTANNPCTVEENQTLQLTLGIKQDKPFVCPERIFDPISFFFNNKY